MNVNDNMNNEKMQSDEVVTSYRKAEATGIAIAMAENNISNIYDIGDEDPFKEILEKMIYETNNESKLLDANVFDTFISIYDNLLPYINSSNELLPVMIPVPLYGDTDEYYVTSIFETIQMYMIMFGYTSSYDDKSDITKSIKYNGRDCYPFTRRYMTANNKALSEIGLQHAMLLFYSKYIYAYMIYCIIEHSNLKNNEFETELLLGIRYVNKISSKKDISCYIEEGDIVDIIEKCIDSVAKIYSYRISHSYDHETGRLGLYFINIEYARIKAEEVQAANKADTNIITNSYCLQNRFWMLSEIISAAKRLCSKRNAYIMYCATDKVSSLYEELEFTRSVYKNTDYIPADYMWRLYMNLADCGELAKLCDAYDIEIFANYDPSISKDLSIVRVKIVNRSYEDKKD